jgi:superfamily II DNA or RNA helicase
MFELIQIATREIQTFLANELPSLSENWWQRLVVDELSFQQQRLVKERGLDDLRKLDLAALLRVLDRNWFELSGKVSLPREARGWVKELQTVRNRWAHMGTEDIPPSEEYRDVDTLGRVLESLGTPTLVLKEIDVVKVKLAGQLSGPAPTMATNERVQDTQEQTHTGTPGLFSVGEIVCLRSDLNVHVPIIGIIPGSGELRYSAFVAGKVETFYERQLRAIHIAEPLTTLTADQLRARLTALTLQFPSAKNLHSLQSGRINFVPYQYRPVLKLIQADRPRMLIADEVGVGKTIEAGLIIQELKSRMDLSSVLIICPKALVAERKWEKEMKRFDEKFTNLDGKLLRHCMQETHLDGEWPEQYAKSILPFSLFNEDLVYGPTGRKKRSKGLLSLDPPPKFDLVIVDEAHNIRNSDTYLHQGVKYFCDHATAVVFLTATPVQLGSEDLYTLLNVIRPDLVMDPTSFDAMSAPNKYIHAAVTACRKAGATWASDARAELIATSETEWGRLFIRETPEFQSIYDLLSEDELDDQTRVRLVRDIERLNTFSGLINRTRRRDIGEFTVRKPETLSVDFTPSQKELHDKLLQLIASILSYSHGDRNVKFMMTTIRRQAASSLHGLAPLLRDIMARRIEALEALEASDSDGSAFVEDTFLSAIQPHISDLLDLARDLDDQDPKADALIQAVTQKLQMENNKALVFTSFRHTIAYLAKRMAGRDIRLGIVHGGVADEIRADLRHRFSLPKEDPNAIDILLSSEVGCEGLDFQFCDFLINYDLPWNPMRVEQRIGRVDRYGQKSESVSIINIITPGTVDADIYERCLWRIGVFEHAIGGSEEILGEITTAIHDIAENFALSEEEKCGRLRQLADNKIRQIEEQQELEERQAELFGLNVPKQEWLDDVNNASSYWLSPAAIQLCIERYLKEVSGSEKTHITGDKEIKSLRLNQDTRKVLLTDYKQLPRSQEPKNRVWEKWLKGQESTLAVTFVQTGAVEEQSAVLVSLSHPLVKQAVANALKDSGDRGTFEVSSDEVPEGQYPFALYHWRKQGGKTDEELVTVCENENAKAHIQSWLVSAVETEEIVMLTDEQVETLEALHHDAWSRNQANHIEENRQSVGQRIQSLVTSHKARCKAIEDQLTAATNDKIKLMKQSELTRANADFEAQLEELEQAAESGDIHASLIVTGVMVVTGKVVL